MTPTKTTASASEAELNVDLLLKSVIVYFLNGLLPSRQMVDKLAVDIAARYERKSVELLAASLPKEGVSIEDGKYTVQADGEGRLRALRYGEPWRDLTGDKFTLCMAQEIQSLRFAKSDHDEQVRALVEALKLFEDAQTFYPDMRGPSRPGSWNVVRLERAIKAASKALASFTSPDQPTAGDKS